MSSILKALRKIEEEKRVARPAAPDLRVDQGLTPARSGQYLPLLTGVVLGAVVVGLFTFWPSRNKDLPLKVDAQTSHSSSAAVPSRAIKGSLAVKSADSDVTLPPSPKPAVSQDVDVASRPAANPDKQLKQKPLPSVDPALKVGLSSNLAIPPSAAVSTVLPDGVSLLVSEIFWQEKSSDSMAVVNDLPVMVGTYVDSAIVDEIRKEHILFKIEDKLYIVGLSGI